MEIAPGKYAAEARDVWRKMRTIPGFTEALKTDFEELTGEDFALAPVAVIGTANLLAAVDRTWTMTQVNRIISEAKALGVQSAYNVAMAAT
ncbi:MAG: hypothetical protein JZU50_08295 [Desulfobulbaceae bacterium]|jgi:hypothetical protein|nr:hypothetical protein [Desulfobulbaceae bacterium]